MCASSSPRLFSSRMMARRSRRASLRSTSAFSIDSSSYPWVWHWNLKSLAVSSKRAPAGETPAFMSARACFGEELSLSFEPIRIGVASQGESAAAFRNKIGAHANFLVRRLRRFACFRRHRDFWFSRRRSLLSSGSGAFSNCRCPGRRRRFFDFHLGGRPAGLWRSSFNFGLDNFVLFRHRLSGVDDFNSFTVHRTIGKLFLGRLWYNEKPQ